MQAIQTKYHGPTNHRGSRITAKCVAGSLTVGYDHGLGLEENHKAAAKAMCEKLGWIPKPGENTYTPMSAGQLPDGSFVHVFLPYRLRGCRECQGTGRRIINSFPSAYPCGLCWGTGAITEE